MFLIGFLDDLKIDIKPLLRLIINDFSSICFYIYITYKNIKY